MPRIEADDANFVSRLVSTRSSFCLFQFIWVIERLFVRCDNDVACWGFVVQSDTNSIHCVHILLMCCNMFITS
uniref:Uncharacterized protein n=1 Tax=Ciona intestinalis TaxID=7719 RepID=H2XT51_CIOIN